MKKIIAIMMVLAMLFALTACGSKKEEAPAATEAPAAEAAAEAPAEEAAAEEAPAEEAPAEEAAAEETTEG